MLRWFRSRAIALRLVAQDASPAQDAIRRAATAIHESRSSDLYALAVFALEAAIPDEIALLELLPSPNPVKSTLAQAMALA